MITSLRDFNESFPYYQTRIFVTHNVTYLPYVDQIIVIQDGTIVESGTYEELLKKDGDFSSFLATYVKDTEESLYDSFPS